MLVGDARFRDAGEELIRILTEELAAFGLRADLDGVAESLGLTWSELEAAVDRGTEESLQELITRWDRFAEPRTLAHLVLVDHGDELELLLGHPVRPEHLHLA
jgi:hypothetical protein